MSAASPISDLVLFPRLKQHSSLGYAIFMAEGKKQKNWQNLAMPINLQLRCDINYIHSHSIGQNGLQSLSQSHVAMKEELLHERERIAGNNKATYRRGILCFPTTVGFRSHLLILSTSSCFSFLVDSIFVLY